MSSVPAEAVLILFSAVLAIVNGHVVALERIHVVAAEIAIYAAALSLVFSDTDRKMMPWLALSCFYLDFCCPCLRRLPPRSVAEDFMAASSCAPARSAGEKSILRQRRLRHGLTQLVGSTFFTLVNSIAQALRLDITIDWARIEFIDDNCRVCRCRGKGT